MDVNKGKYNACRTTPFMQEPLRSLFGIDGSSPAIAATLNGAFNRMIADAYSQLLLEELRMPDGQPYSPTTPNWITTEEHIRAWKRAKERTSAGPSGLHFGMFKANIQDPDLAALDASMRNVAYSTGHIYKRWLSGVDVQLL